MDSFVGDGGKAIAPHGEGLLPPMEVAGWRAPAGEVVPHPQPREAVSFTDFHKRGFTVPTSHFLCEYGVQLQHLPPNAVS